MPDKASIRATITNRLGLHARPAMAFVDMAAGYAAAITVRRADDDSGEALDGKSIMHVMMLAATKGVELEITAEGDDAQQACDALAKLVNSGFGED